MGMASSGSMKRVRVGAVAALSAAAVSLAACSEEQGNASTEREEARVCEVRKHPERFGDVRVMGEAWATPRMRRHGFALSAGGCSIFVAADRLDRMHARAGTPVTVNALAERLRAVDVDRLLGPDHPPGVTRVAVDGAPPLSIGTGAAVIESFATQGEDVVQTPEA